MSNEQGTETRLSSLYSAVLVLSSVRIKSVTFSQLFLAIASTACPTSLSLCLKVIEFIVGMFMQDKILLI